MGCLIYEDMLHIEPPPTQKKNRKKNIHIRDSSFLPFRWIRCWKQRVNASIEIYFDFPGGLGK